MTFVVTHGKTSGTGVSSSTPAATTTTSTGTGTTTTSTGTSTTQTGTSTTTTQPKPAEPAIKPGQGLPAGVASALDRHDIVVLFFYEPAGADDQATRAAVRAVRSIPGVRLFSDTVSHISNYRRVVGSLGISQSPAMVVIDRKRTAQLFEGFLDAGSIRQSVRDAL